MVQYKYMQKGFAPIIVILTLLVIVVMAGGAIYLYKQATDTSNDLPPQVMDEAINQEEIDICDQNSDCMAVSHESCCLNKIAINKKYKALYDTHPAWQSTPRQPDCNVISCINTDSNRAFCNIKDSKKNIKRCELFKLD